MARQRVKEDSDAMSCAKEAIPVLLVIFCYRSTKKKSKIKINLLKIQKTIFKEVTKKFVFNPEHKEKSQTLNISPVVQYLKRISYLGK